MFKCMNALRIFSVIFKIKMCENSHFFFIEIFELMQNLCSVCEGRQTQQWDRTMDFLCGHVKPQAAKSHTQTFRFHCETADTTEISLLTPCSWACARIALAQLGTGGRKADLQHSQGGAAHCHPEN